MPPHHTNPHRTHINRIQTKAHGFLPGCIVRAQAALIVPMGCDAATRGNLHPSRSFPDELHHLPRKPLHDTPLPGGQPTLVRATSWCLSCPSLPTLCNLTDIAQEGLVENFCSGRLRLPCIFLTDTMKGHAGTEGRLASTIVLIQPPRSSRFLTWTTQASKYHADVPAPSLC